MALAHRSLSKNSISIQETHAIQNANSILDIFYLREKLHPNKVYLRQPKGEAWKELTWSEVGQQARKILTVLRDQGLTEGDHVGILSKNCSQWIIADLAIMMGGFVSVPFYPTLSATDLKEVISLSNIKALFVGKVETWDEQKQAIPDELICISFPHYDDNSQVDCELKWDKLLTDFSPAEQVHSPKRNDLFTIIFTSGTTGTPKGVMLTYECVNQVLINERASPVYGIYQGVSERVISYLPLNHIAERVVSEMSSIAAGTSVSFSESLEQFATNLQSVQPTLFFAVPRIWAKIQQGILTKLPQYKLDILLKLPIVSRVVKNKIRQGLGLSEVRSAISGAAPVSAELLDWFSKLDIHIQEVYGATELCGGVSYNALDDIATGTVGKPLPGTDIKIDPESDEVLVKAPWTMTGYYQSPKKTKEVMHEGFYRTGDTGKFDKDNNLIITGRIKDTFKTAKGKFVLPLPIEHKFATNPLIEQVMVTGIGLVQPIALVCVTEQANLEDDTHIESLISTLAEVNLQSDKHEKILTLVVFTEGWSDDSGFFTPTLKLKRHIIDQAYKADYESWQAAEETIILV